MARVVLFHKPYGVLSQFTDRATPPRPTLAGYVPIPEVYVAGRLDRDSEGLLVLTDDGALQARLSSPRFAHRKRYVVQVAGTPPPEAFRALCAGVLLGDGPAHALRASAHPSLAWPREPAVTHRGRTSWAMVELDEGRNRQVRRMFAAVGFPVLRLVRTQLGPFALGDLPVGSYRLSEVHLPATANRSTKPSSTKTRRHPAKR